MRALALALLLAPLPASAQTWFPIDTGVRDAPGMGAPAPGGFAGMPPSPQVAPPQEVLPRHRYDPAAPSRGLPGDGKGVPLLTLSGGMEGALVDRPALDTAANPQPQVPVGQEGAWISGMPNVVDGDSIGLNGMLIRLAGIDAPEVDQICYRGNIPHRCGIDARSWLAATIEDTRLDCRVHYPDGAQRLVATCWSNRREVGAMAIQQGWALVWAGAPSPYRGMEEAARQVGVGVWAFDFRHPSEWRTLMQAERDAQDARIASGAEAPTKPFPYAPFTERHHTPTNIPVYTVPAR